MYHIKDRCKLDADEIKRELYAEADAMRQGFDRVLADSTLDDEQRLNSLIFAANASATIFNFLSKIGIEIREDDGCTAGTAAQGYFMAKISDIKQRINTPQGY